MPAKPLISPLALCLLTACTSGPSHIGNPLSLPGRAITHGISEAAYKAQRQRVKTFVLDNRPGIQKDISSGGGETLSQAMNIARVPTAKRIDLITELQSNPALYSQADIEPLIVAIMVNSN